MHPGEAKHQKNAATVLGSYETKVIFENNKFRFSIFSSVFQVFLINKLC